MVSFVDQEDDYARWTAAHPDGYVVNVARSGRGPVWLHRGRCFHIASAPPRWPSTTSKKAKHCFLTADELSSWLRHQGITVYHICRTCQPDPI
jgi:hypothetical protein